MVEAGPKKQEADGCEASEAARIPLGVILVDPLARPTGYRSTDSTASRVWGVYCY